MDKYRRTGQYTKDRNANGYFEGYFHLIFLEHRNCNIVSLSVLDCWTAGCHWREKLWSTAMHSFHPPWPMVCQISPPTQLSHLQVHQDQEAACGSRLPFQQQLGAWTGANWLRTCSAEHLQNPVLASSETHSPRLKPNVDALKSPVEASSAVNTGTIYGGLDK